MSSKNPYLTPGKNGRVSHKRTPRKGQIVTREKAPGNAKQALPVNQEPQVK